MSLTYLNFLFRSIYSSANLAGLWAIMWYSSMLKWVFQCDAAWQNWRCPWGKISLSEAAGSVTRSWSRIGGDGTGYLAHVNFSFIFLSPLSHPWWWHLEWKQYVLYGGTRSGSNMCCMVAPGMEAIYVVWWHQEWKQYVLYGGTRSGSNMCCMLAPGVEAICAVWWHQEWKQYVLYGGTRSGSNICCMVAPGMEAICAVWWHQEWNQIICAVWWHQE